MLWSPAIEAEHRATRETAGLFDESSFAKLEVSGPGIVGKPRVIGGAPAGPARFHLIATLHFDDLPAVAAAFASPQGQAAAADVAKFATGGAEMVFFDNAEV